MEFAYSARRYGNITCRTPIGRLITILYALFGIPMMLAVLNVIGKGLFGQAQSSYMFVRRFIRRRIRRFKRSRRGLDRAGTVETVITEDPGKVTNMSATNSLKCCCDLQEGPEKDDN
ncbi:unnamed protein product, partial [Cylicostephanus goldi]